MTKINTTNIDDSILVKILEKTASNKEQQKFDAWIDADTNNKETFFKLKKAWKHSNQIKIFDKIDVASDWKKVKALAQTKNKSYIWKIVASIAILITVSYGVLYQTTPGFGKLSQLKTNIKKNEILLADGTQVFLNKNSKLVYPNKFGKQRNVKLIGEGYFKVAKNAQKPFIISANNATITVIGTAFNVNSKQQKTIVTVNSGKVSLVNKNNKKTVFLTKGEMGIVNDTVVTEQQNSNYNFDAWKTGILRFNATPIPVVFQHIENFYSVKITNKINSINQLKLTTIFNNASINEVAQELELQLNVKITINKKHLVIQKK